MSQSILQLAISGVQHLQPYKPGKPLSELEREYGIRDSIKLASNENPLGPGERVIEAITRALPELSRYPDGNGFALKSALSEKLQVPAAWITLGNGSNDILELVSRAFLTPETDAVFSEHAFAVYPIVTQAVGARACVAKAHAGGRGPKTGHDLEAMAACVTDRTRIVFVANPNNPTGTWLEHDALKAFVEAIPGHVIVVIDEAYFEYVTEAGYATALHWLEQHPNLLVTRTFSKAYGLAALRVGYGVCQAELAEVLNRVRQPFNVNSLAQVAALAALKDTPHLERSVESNAEGLRQFEAGFTSLGLEYIPSVANFISVNVGPDAAAVYDALLHEGVIVRPIANYGMPEYLRFSVGTAQENRRALDALGKVLS